MWYVVIGSFASMTRVIILLYKNAVSRKISRVVGFSDGRTVSLPCNRLYVPQFTLDAHPSIIECRWIISTCYVTAVPATRRAINAKSPYWLHKGFLSPACTICIAPPTGHVLHWSPVSIQTQSLALRALRKRKPQENKRKRQLIGMLGRSSGNHDWLLANASDCVWMETGLEILQVLSRKSWPVSCVVRPPALLVLVQISCRRRSSHQGRWRLWNVHEGWVKVAGTAVHPRWPSISRGHATVIVTVTAHQPPVHAIQGSRLCWLLTRPTCQFFNHTDIKFSWEISTAGNNIGLQRYCNKPIVHW